MKKVGRAPMLVGQPDGSFIRREIKMTFDDASGGSFEIEVIGESPLKGYTFTVRQGDLKAVRDHGVAAS